MQIILAKDIDKDKWDGYLDRFPYYPPLNYFAWKKILESSYKVKTYFFIALNESNQICGILPTYITKGFRGSRTLYSLRFGLIADTEDIKIKMLEYLEFFCRDNNISSNLISPGYDRINCRFKEIMKKTIIMELASSEEETWNSLRDKTRNMVRKAIKSDLLAEEGFHNLKAFYDIYSLSMHNKGVPLHRYNFFLNITKEMHKQTKLIVAKKEGRAIAGILLIFAKKSGIYPYQASLSRYRQYAPSQFLIWEAIKKCLEKKISILDMGESKEGGNVYLSKINFGGQPRDVYYYTTFLPQGIVESNLKGPIGENQSSSLIFRLLNNAPIYIKKRLASYTKKTQRII